MKLNSHDVTWLIQESYLKDYKEKFKTVDKSSMVADTTSYSPPAPIDSFPIGIVQINGIIMKGTGCSPEDLNELGICDLDNVNAELDLIADNPNIKNVVLLFNSPGGQDTGVIETAKLVDTISKTKRVIAYSDNLFCSAAYFIGSQANYVYCSTSAKVGCIGVVRQVIDTSEALKEQGITINSFVGGKYKLIGSPEKPMTNDEKTIVQGKVDKLYDTFKTTVTNKRSSVTDEAMQGLVYDGIESVTNGLSDGVIDRPEDLLELLQY